MAPDIGGIAADILSYSNILYIIIGSLFRNNVHSIRTPISEVLVQLNIECQACFEQQ